MNFLLFSDLHLNKFPYSNITKHGDNELLFAGLSIFDQVYDRALDYGIKLIIFLGDVFHIRTMIDSEIYTDLVYDKLSEYFGQGDIRLILIPGNHDQINKEGKHTLKPYSRIPNITVINELTVHRNLIFCPHQYYNERLYKFLEEFSDERSFIFMHQLIVNSPRMSGAVFRKNEAVSLGGFKYKMLFSGHNHRPFENKDLNVYNIGSPMHYDFGDAECQNRFMVHFNEGQVTWIPTEFPHFAMADTDNVKKAKYIKKQSKKVTELVSRLNIEWNDDIKNILKAYIKSEAKNENLTKVTPTVLLSEGLRLLNSTI